MDFEDMDALLLTMSKDMSIVLDNISDKYVEEMKKSVEMEVYNTPFLPKVYQRLGENGGFLGSWIKQRTKNLGLSLENTIFSDPDRIKFFPEEHIHGNFWEGNRASFLDRAIAEGTDYDFVVPEEYTAPGDNWWTRPRDYFSPVIAEIEYFLDEDVKKEFGKLGINII